MAKTLGERYDSILSKIDKAENAQSYQTSNGNQVARGSLSKMYNERDSLLDKINSYGRNYIEGQNSSPIGDTAYASF